MKIFSRKRIFWAMLLAIASFLKPNLAFAQELPPNADTHITQKKIETAMVAELEKPSETPKTEIEKPQEKKPATANVETPFFIREFVIEGNETIPTEELKLLTATYEGKNVAISQVNELASKIEHEYHRQGYVTTIVYIPPQKVENQTLKLRITEGKIGNLHVEGGRWFSKGTTRRYWRYKTGSVLRYEKILRNLRRMNENPDRKVQSILRPGIEKGYSDIYLKVKDQFPGHLGFQYDNQGVRSTGHRRYGFTARYNNCIWPDSVCLAGTVLGKDFEALYGQYLLPVTSFGTKLALGYSRSNVSPKRELKGNDVEGFSKTYSSSIRQVLFEGDRFSSSAHAGYDFKDSSTRDVTGTRRRDRLRVLNTGFIVTQYDRRGTTNLSNGFGFGTKLFGATGERNLLTGRAGAEPAFFKYTGSLSRSLTLPFETQAIFNSEFQITPHKLVPQEEFYLGGANTIRGYPEGNFLADQGVFYNFEYLIPMYLFPADWQLPHLNTPLRKMFQIALFIDEGFGRLRGPAVTEIRSRHLLGLGGGLRVRLSNHLFAKIDIAHALGQEPITESDHTRLHFQLQTEV